MGKNINLPVYRFVEHKRTVVRYSCVVTYLRIDFCLQVEGSGRQNTAPIVAIANIVIQIKRFPGISIQSIDRKQTRSISGNAFSIIVIMEQLCDGWEELW